MKKKEKTAKKADMPSFDFKEFTDEESRIYEEAIPKFREAVDAGKTLRQAYESYAIADKKLEKLIQVDFLKILIAERHFGQHQSLDDIAKALDVSASLIKDTHARMLQEVGVTAASQFGEQFNGIIPKTND
jgi:transcription initiation factor TFIIIB Brf1 subunit/transcription initiation factor TFIIB